MISPGIYRHFKGGLYEVLFTARHSETGEEMAVYRALYGSHGVWVRPAAMWNETVEREGQPRPRFAKLREEELYRFHGWEWADVPPVLPGCEKLRDPRGLYDLLKGVWAADTCAPRMRADWSQANPTLGQCSITAFLVQDIFGGKVFGIPLADGGFHCFNRVGDREFDLTSEQFGDTVLNYSGCPEQQREVHFARAEKRERYELLRKRTEALLGAAIPEARVP